MMVETRSYDHPESREMERLQGELKFKEERYLKTDQRSEPFAIDLGSGGDVHKILELLAEKEFSPMEIPLEARNEGSQRLWYIFPVGGIQAVGAIAFRVGEWTIVSETRLRRWARDLRFRINAADRQILESAPRREIGEWGKSFAFVESVLRMAEAPHAR